VNRLVAVALVGSLAACNPRPTMAVGGLTVAGGLLIAVAPNDCDEQTFCLFDNQDVGGLIAVIGLTLFVIGAIGLANEQPRPAAQPGLVNAPPAPFPVGPDPSAPPQEPSETRFPDPPGTPPLPALELHYPSPAERQYAIQASSAARRGDCRAAKTSAEQLTVDTRHRLASVDVAFASCQDQP
jgi:hypothetical protein